MHLCMIHAYGITFAWRGNIGCLIVLTFEVHFRNTDIEQIWLMSVNTVIEYQVSVQN